MMNRRLRRTSVLLLVLSISWPQLGFAASFNKDLLITDEEMLGGTFSQRQTIDFLKAKGGYLGGRADEFGTVIYDAAITNGLNPQFLLAQIQKESSLIEDPNPSKHQIDYALGFGCPDNGSCNPAYAGFSVQVTKAAEVFRKYLNDLATVGLTVSGWKVGAQKRTGAPRDKSNPSDSGWEYINGQPVLVTPANQATAALYTYNPWVGGHDDIGANYNFWAIWNRYFRLTRLYPDGTLLRGKGDSTIWLLSAGQRHAFRSMAAFLANYDPKKVINVPADELLAYDPGSDIRFAEFSLLQAPNGGVYLLSDNHKRPIVSRAVFRKIGFNPEEVVKVSWQDLAPYADGEPITTDAVKPTGRLVQLSSGGVAYIDGTNVRHAIYSKDIMRSQFPHRPIEKINSAVLATATAGDPVKFRDGELVTAPGAGAVYLISDGQKRPIASATAFKAYRFRWRNVITTTQRALEIHPTGAPLDIQPT